MHGHYLWEKLGTQIQQALQDDSIFEVILNPDQSLWVLDKKKGYICIGSLSIEQAMAFVFALAKEEQQFLNHKIPYLDATLPFHGERVNVTIPPITENVSFNIRKKSKVIFTLKDYVSAEVLTQRQADILVQAIFERKNILVSGSPASGKTTLANALLAVMAEVAPDGHRVLILEQVPELQCRVRNLKRLLVSEHASMNTLLWIAMRNSPDRIIVGEVRDGAALDLLKAWNTGCQGGLATIHANSARAAVQRVLDLACEVVARPPYLLTAEALDLIVHIEANSTHPAGRVVTEIIQVQDFNVQDKQYSFKNLR